MANEDLLFNRGIRLIDKPNTREIKSLIFQGITKVKAWPSWMKRERERKGLTAMVEAGPTETIAEHLSRTRFDELPDEAVQATVASWRHFWRLRIFLLLERFSED